jgi:predicted Zn-dependent peptidase
MTIKKITFPNGFRFVYEKLKNSAPITSIQVFCDLGSVYENDETRGISHFIEHMTFKGTKKNPNSIKLFLEYDKIGAELNAYTDKRFTCYMVKCEDEHVENSLKVLADMLLNSTFDRTEYKKEEKVVIEENINSNDDPENILYEELEKMLYKGSAYSKPVDTIAYHKGKLEYETVMKVYKTFYVANRMVVSIVSHLDLKDLVHIMKNTDFTKKVEKVLPCSTYSYEKELIPQKEIGYHISKKVGMKTIQLTIGFRVSRKDEYLLNFLKNILSGPMSSRLFRILREENGLTYTSSISTDYYDEVGDFTIFAEMDYKKIIKNGSKNGVLPLIIDLLNDLRDKGVCQEEIENTKGYVNGMMDIEVEDSDTSVEHNGRHVLLYPSEELLPYSKIFEKKIKKITKGDIDNVIQFYLKKENMSVCLIGENIPTLATIKKECEKME